MAKSISDAGTIDLTREAAKGTTPALLLRRFGAPAALVVVLIMLSFVLPVAQLLVVENVLILALFAVATNLVLGYGGLVSFGQASFYGLGAYVVAASWLHYQTPFWLSFLLSPVLGAVLALLVGALALRTRRLYFALLTLAFSQLFFTIAEKWYDFTQGDNGIFGAIIPAGLAAPQTSFLFVLAITVVSMLILWKVTDSPFGLVLRMIRENRERAEALGVDVYRHQLLAFIISGAFCAVAGALFVVHDQSAYPQLLDWTKSGDPVLVAVIGGMFSFLGPALGALVYQYGHDLIVQHTTHWQLVLGLVLLFCVMFFPDGLIGLFSARGWQQARARLQALSRRRQED